MKRLLLRLSLLSVFLIGSAFASGPWVSVSATVAGRDVPVRISGLLEQESLSILLIRPDGSKISLEASTDVLGVASFFIHGLNVRQAGEYELLIRRGQSSQVLSEQFVIAPAAISAYRSTQSVDIPSLAADGEQVARIRVQVKDAHGNLIAKAPVRAFSSRTEDSVVIAPQTNNQGEVIIKVSSQTPGVSSISVLAGETLLFERTELVFHLANTGTAGMGASGIGKFLQTSLFEDPQESTPVAYFSIEDIGSEVVAGKNLTIRIGAKDKNGDVVTDYTGTIRFSSSDDRAVLPNDYTFVTEDQGWHTFYLSVMLQTTGMQTVAVHDLDDFRISGERNVTVADGSGIVTVPNAAPELRIDVPLSGATFNTSRVMISGTATGISMIQLMDGPIELIASLPVDASGTYVYQTPGLADGTHIFQAIAVEDPTIVSNVVQITIDRSPPQVMSAEISPAGDIAPGTEFTLNIGATDELSAVSCVFLGQTHELIARDAKNFTVTLRAPMETGEYPVEITLADLLGNKMTEPNGGIVVVKKTEEILATFTPSGVVAPGTKVGLNITTNREMTNVVYSLINQETGLVYQEAGGNSALGQGGGIDSSLSGNGQGGGDLGNDIIDSSLSGNALGGGNLGNGLTDSDLGSNDYGSQVKSLVAVDSRNFSGTLNAPMTQGRYVIEFVGTDLNGNKVVNPESPILVVEGESIAIAPLPATNIQTQPGEKKVTVLWSPAVDDKGIKNYRINFGPSESDLNGVNVTPDARTQWYVDGLPPGVLQYFQVTPIDVDGIEGPGSIIVSGMPNSEGEEQHPAPPKTGGSTSLWFAIFSILSGLGVVILLRRRA